MHYRMPKEQHEKLFGPRDDLDSEGPGRSRKCKVCGGWHRLDKPWPHNCRSEAPPRADFATPMVAPPFRSFKTGVLEDAVVINSRHDKREHMKRNDLVEYDAGVGDKAEWVEEKRREQEIVQTIKRVMEEDPINRPPMEYVGEADTQGAGEIDTDNMEVVE